MFYRGNKINKPTTAAVTPMSTTTTTTTTTTPTTMTTAEESDTQNVTPVPTNNADTPLRSLLNFTINRRITLRPASRNVQTLQQSSTPVSAADTSLGENPAARAVPDRDTNSNVVYVTAVGASSDQQAIAYVNMNAGFNADQKSNDENITGKVNYNPIVGLLYEYNLSTDNTTSDISQEE